VVQRLDNGCACCQPGGGGLIGALEALRRSAAKRGQRWDHYVVELSGAADPTRVAQSLTDPKTADQDWVFGRTVTVVAADTLKAYLSSQEDASGVPREVGVAQLMATQLEGADLILLNKCDLMGQSESQTEGFRVQEEVKLLRALNPSAAVLPVARGELEAKTLLPDPADPEKKKPKLSQELVTATTSCGCGAGDHGGDHTHAHGHTHSHEHGATQHLQFHNFVYQCPRPFRQSLLRDMLAAELPTAHLSSTSSPTPPVSQSAAHSSSPMAKVLRAKGWASFCATETEQAGQGAGTLLYLSWVGSRIELREADDVFGESGRAGSETKPEIVFIGYPGLDEAGIRTLMDRCLMHLPPESSTT